MVIVLLDMVLMDNLEKLLRKHGDDNRVDVYLIATNVLPIAKFVDLADSKADVADSICVPAGLDKNDKPACGPVKSAWREADALAEAALAEIKKGKHKMPDLDDPIDAHERVQKTNSFVACCHIKLLAHLIGSDTFLGRLVREHARRIPTAYDIRKVKSLAFRATKPGEDVTCTETFGADGYVSSSIGQSADLEPLTFHVFIYRHRTLMNSLALSVAPEWAQAEWSVLLEYHEWVVAKLFEKKKSSLPPLASIVEADHSMRTKWVVHRFSRSSCTAVWGRQRWSAKQTATAGATACGGRCFHEEEDLCVLQ